MRYGDDGIPIAGWDWDEVDGEARVDATTWVQDIAVVGTFDGTTFALTQPAVPAPTSTTIDRSAAVPCPVPSRRAAGGRSPRNSRAGSLRSTPSPTPAHHRIS